MTDAIFLRGRLALTALFLTAEAIHMSRFPADLAAALPTLLLAPAVFFPQKRRFFAAIPALWLLICCVLRLAELFASRAMTALDPALCALAFLLAALQLARHGQAVLCQWSRPVALLIGAACLLAFLLGWPDANDLWFLLLLLPAELARCAALIILLR